VGLRPKKLVTPEPKKFGRVISFYFHSSESRNDVSNSRFPVAIEVMCHGTFDFILYPRVEYIMDWKYYFTYFLMICSISMYSSNGMPLVKRYIRSICGGTNEIPDVLENADFIFSPCSNINSSFAGVRFLG